MKRLLTGAAITIVVAALAVSPAHAATPTAVLPPSSCAAVKAADPAATDGTYAILPLGLVASLLGGLLNVYCGDMAGSPKEYITLAHTGPGENYSEYAAGGASGGTSVVTQYRKIRFNPIPISYFPITFEANTVDQTYATSTGALCHVGGNPPCTGDSTYVTSMPYADAAGCDKSANGSANVDFRGTPFNVVNSFVVAGYMAVGTTTVAGTQVINVTGGGDCGWNAMSHDRNPFNTTGGWDVHLTLAGL